MIYDGTGNYSLGFSFQGYLVFYNVISFAISLRNAASRYQHEKKTAFPDTAEPLIGLHILDVIRTLEPIIWSISLRVYGSLFKQAVDNFIWRESE